MQMMAHSALTFLMPRNRNCLNLFDLFEHLLHDLLSHIRVPEGVLRQRLFARWEGYGIPAAEILAKVEGNDCRTACW